MTNQQFTEYLQNRLDNLRKMKDAPDRPDNYDAQEQLLLQALKIMKYSTGPERRRFRRDYEGRLGLKRRRPL